MVNLRSTIALVFFLGSISAEEQEIGGLYFKSNYDAEGQGRLGKGTTLVIPDAGELVFGSDFTLEFDIYFWRKSPFGFILSAGNEECTDMIVMSYSNYRHDDTSYIELTYRDRPSVLSIPVADNDQGMNIWKKLLLKIDYSANRVGLSFEGSDISWYRPGKSITRHFQFRFGSTSRQIEPPSMALRNIRVHDNNIHAYGWQLNDTDGDVVTGTSAAGFAKHGKMENGIWLAGRHSFWHRVYQQDIKGAEIRHLGYDAQSGQFIYLQNDSLVFQYVKNTFVREKYPFVFLLGDFTYGYNPVLDQVFAIYRGGGGPIVIYDQETGIWEDYDPDFVTNEQYYEKNILIDPENGDIYTLGGYGWYTQKNDLQRYDRDSKTWVKIPFKTQNDIPFYPRSNCAIAYNTATSSFLVMGGNGNESGRQEQGFRRLNDLWSLDLKSRTMTQILPDDPTIISSNTIEKSMILPLLNQVYRLALNENEQGIYNYSLYSASMENKNLVNTNIGLQPVNADQFEIIALHHLEKTKELFLAAVNQTDNANVTKKVLEFYTISLPVLPLVPEKPMTAIWEWLFFLGFLSVMYWLFSRGVVRLDLRKIVVSNVPRAISARLNGDLDYVLDKGITVRSFDEFQLWIDGDEIHYSDWSSRKSREIFLYILYHNHQGVTGDEISNVFWPGYPRKSSTNSRSVAISRIRAILGPYKKMLAKVNGRFRMEANGMLFFDQDEVQKIIANGHSMGDQVDKLPLVLYGRGNILPDLEGDWIEEMRGHTRENVIKYGKKLGKRYLQQEKWRDLEWVGEKLLSWNHLDDDGLSFVVIANKNLDKHGVARTRYLEFKDLYLQQIGEKYNISYNDMN